MPRPGRSPLLPRGVWFSTVNDGRLEESNEPALTPTGSFRRDVLDYCKLHDLVPHPKLLPLHADEEENIGADEPGNSGNVYDLSEVDHVIVKHWALDVANCRALCFALPHAATLRSLWYCFVMSACH